MKYLILASLLASAAIAAPAPARGKNNGGNTDAENAASGNADNNGNQAGAGAASQQGAGATGNTDNGNANTGATGNAGAAGNTGNTAATGAVLDTGVQPMAAGAASIPGNGIQDGEAATGATSPPGTAGTAPGLGGGTPTPADLATAVANWQADTSMVSMFLNNGPSIQDDTAFKIAAAVAYNAEIDELTHKAVIDAVNGNDPNVQAANSTLATGMAFQDVVDKLAIMAQQGKAAADNIDLINQNRCTNVLPNIDAYMASTGSNSQAVRPNVCDQTGVAGGVQSNGPTQPGQTPGTPAAAFAAAQAQAAGTGNGQMNLGAATGANGQAGNAQAQTGNGQATGVDQAGNAQAQTGAQGTQGANGQQQAGNVDAAQGQAAQGQAAQGQATQGQAIQGQAAQKQSGRN